MAKKKLLNRKNKTELINDLNNEDFERKTCSFYRYVKILNPEEMRNKLISQWSNYKILGRTYISEEGINAQISVPKHLWNDFILSLDNYKEFKSMHIKHSVTENQQSFIKLIIRIKNKLVADGLDNSEYDFENVGKHLSAIEFNDAMLDPNTIVVDMRNYYESEVGQFENAICPDVPTFRDALPEVKKQLKKNKDNKILLYCTGGIRCEKASAYLKHNGFKDVNQLNGGIIEYAHQMKKHNLKSKFVGKNFVFDYRMSEKITNDIISNCHQCDKPSSNHTNCNNQACHILFIQCNNCFNQYNGCCSIECKNIMDLPKEEQKRIRKFPDKAAPLKKYQKNVKPRLKDLLKEHNKVKQPNL